MLCCLYFVVVGIRSKLRGEETLRGNQQTMTKGRQASEIENQSERGVKEFQVRIESSW